MLVILPLLNALQVHTSYSNNVTQLTAKESRVAPRDELAGLHIY